MLIKLDLQLDVPLYQQIRTQIIEGIGAGRLKPGQPLPSVRHLASELGIHFHTVNKAYALLKQDGFILIHRQRGVVVHPDRSPGLSEAYENTLKEAVKPLVAEAFSRGMSKVELLRLVETLYDSLELERNANGPGQ